MDSLLASQENDVSFAMLLQQNRVRDDNENQVAIQSIRKEWEKNVEDHKKEIDLLSQRVINQDANNKQLKQQIEESHNLRQQDKMVFEAREKEFDDTLSKINLSMLKLSEENADIINKCNQDKLLLEQKTFLQESQKLKSEELIETLNRNLTSASNELQEKKLSEETLREQLVAKSTSEALLKQQMEGKNEYINELSLQLQYKTDSELHLTNQLKAKIESEISLNNQFQAKCESETALNAQLQDKIASETSLMQRISQMQTRIEELNAINQDLNTEIIAKEHSLISAQNTLQQNAENHQQIINAFEQQITSFQQQIATYQKKEENLAEVKLALTNWNKVIKDQVLAEIEMRNNNINAIAGVKGHRSQIRREIWSSEFPMLNHFNQCSDAITTVLTYF